MRIPVMYAIFFLADPPEIREGMEIEEGAWADVPPDIYHPSGEAGTPERVLCRSMADPRHYRVFKYRKEIDPSRFTPTGMSYGGFYTPSMWGRFIEGWPHIKAFHEIPDNDPPGAYEEALRYLREAR